MHDGRFTFSPEFRKDIDVLIGSVHYLAYPPNASAEEIFETWLDNTMRLIHSGIDILGHPFRWISDRVAISDRTIREVVAEAVRNDVVLEFNSHFEIDTDSKMIDEIIAANQDKAEQYKAGKEKLLGFFVCQTMKASKRSANPQVVNKLLKHRLK
jgi:histidinol phosphatase-like PHP family hydrolase